MSTIKDVAKYAGVSIATVSHIVNGTKSVTPDTREKVLKAIKELNYTTNQTAKSFKTGRKNIIAFVVPDISNNYFANIIDSLEEELGKSNCHLIITNTKEKKEREFQQLKYLTSGIVDGIVLASTAQDYTEIRPFIPDKFPVVLIDRKLDHSPLDIVSVSDTNAITDGMTRLISNGHTKIGYIGDFLHLSTARERLQTYKDLLEDHRIPINESFIKITGSLSHAAYNLTGELLKEGCTAIVIGNNLMTADAYSYLYKNRKDFPNVQILGYYHRDLAQFFSSEDGIIMLNEKDMGTAAARQILDRIKNPGQSQKEIIIYNQYVADFDADQKLPHL